MAIQVRPSKNPEFKTWTHDLIIISNMHPDSNVCGANTLSDGRGMTRHLVNTNWCDVIDMTWSLPQWDWNWNHTFMGTGDTIPAAVGCNPCARLSPVLFLLLSWHLAWWTTPCQKEYCIQQFNTITSCMYSYEYRCSEVWRRKRLWITYPSNGFPSLACCINARGGHQWEGKHAFEDRTSEFEALDVGQMIFNIWPSQVSPIRSSAENWMIAWCHYEETKAMRFSFIFILFTFITGQISTIIRY